MQTLTMSEIEQVNGGSYLRFVITVIDWVGRGYTAYQIAEALKVDVADVTDVMDTKLGIN